VQPALKGQQDKTDQMALRALQAPKAQPVKMERKGHKELLVLTEAMVQPALKALKGQQVQLVLLFSIRISLRHNWQH
jgi:hypothetical protein